MWNGLLSLLVNETNPRLRSNQINGTVCGMQMLVWIANRLPATGKWHNPGYLPSGKTAIGKTSRDASNFGSSDVIRSRLFNELATSGF